MALSFKDFLNNFSRPNVDPKYISGVNLVNIEHRSSRSDARANYRHIYKHKDLQTFSTRIQNRHFHRQDKIDIFSLYPTILKYTSESNE